MDVGGWLRSLGLGKYEAAFRENEIDETVLPGLTAEDLKELGVAALGHRRKLLDAIAALRVGTNVSATADEGPAGDERPRDTAEHRQVTVIFSDLVGSTALSVQMDSEDLREVISAYQKCVAETVGRFGGFVAKYLGDGVLIYFGYPQAHEYDAEQAVRSGLELVTAVSDLKTHAALQARVGIATGLVVVGDLIGSGASQEHAIVGETPNLAARLQSVAAPNSVLIDANTRRLTGDLFEYEPANSGTLKGFDGPVGAWRVLRERTIQSRFEALRAVNLSPLVGREEEIELLLRRWQQAKDGAGRVVLVSGEPGIGKSRLTATLIERLASERPTTLRYFCLPHIQGSALHPIITHLQHAAAFNREDTSAQKRAKLERLLAQDTEVEVVGLLTELLGLVQPQETAVPMDPKRKRDQVLSALIGRFEGMTHKGPVLIAFEDVHWSDPTSLELLTLIVERMPALPILLIITHRPEFQPPWAGQPHVTSMTLNRLGKRERMALVEHVSGGKALPPALVEQIVQRTDGVPLFVEELTKAVLESNELDLPAQQIAIPPTLQASLMARVDRLGSAREVLQIGAAIGREFSYEQITLVAGLSDEVLQDALARLTEADLLLMRSAPPHASYTFKHALVQDTAYSTMLRAHRQTLHGAIAQVLEKRFPDTPPEVLAQQFEGAAQSERAILFWRQAGDRDLRRFAMKESVAHYSSALRLVEAMPPTTARDALELDIRLGIGLVQLIMIGPSATEVAEQYGRALTLSRALPDRGRERFLATWGMWFNSALGGRNDEATLLSDELIAIARELDNPDFLMEAYHARVPMLFWLPDFKGVVEAAQQVIRLYNRERHRDHAYYFGGHDARMCARTFYAFGLWAHGLFEQAQDALWQSIEDARALGHVFSLAHALQRGGLGMALMRDAPACRTIVKELHPITERNRFPWQLMDAQFLQGWLAAQEDDLEGGVETMIHSVSPQGSAGFGLIYVTLILEQVLAAGRSEDALARIERAVDVTRTKGNGFCAPELLRLRGEVLRAQAPGKSPEAESAFREALALARRQSCRPLELRAAVSLARLLRDNERLAQAREVLIPVYEAFTEGFSLPDLKGASKLIAELN